MKLVIVDDDGNVHDVIEDIEDRDLGKPLTRSYIVNQIVWVLGGLLK